jgi:hypothetical protein
MKSRFSATLIPGVSLSDAEAREILAEVERHNLLTELRETLNSRHAAPATKPAVEVIKPIHLGRQRSQETVEHERTIRQIFAGRRPNQRKVSLDYCEKMDATPGIETKKAWQERQGAACPPSYVAAWEYPDPDARTAFKDLIAKEVSRTFRRK